MRVLNIMLGRKRGGLEQVAVDYCVALKSRGHDVRMAVAKGAAVVPQLQKLNIPFTEIPFAYRWNPLARAKLHRLMAGVDVSVVHGNRAGEISAGVKNARVVAVTHSRFFDFYPHFTALIALSEKMAAKHKGHGVPLTIMPNFVEAPQNVPPRPAFRAPVVVGTMGRFSPEKGMDMLVNAAALLKTRGVPFRLIIGGDGPGKAELQAQAEKLGVANDITFAGWITDKPAFFDSIDIFCLPSRTETFTVTLIEAMVYGCPAVSTACGGPSEIIKADVTGLLTPVDDAPAFADALTKLIQDPAASAAMGRAAREDSVRRFDLPVVAAQLETILLAAQK